MTVTLKTWVIAMCNDLGLDPAEQLRKIIMENEAAAIALADRIAQAISDSVKRNDKI